MQGEMTNAGRVLKAPKELFTVHHWDARKLDGLLGRFSTPDQPLVTCTITSPPYGAMKDYGHRDQIGWGQPHDEYLAEMKRVFSSVWRHTRNEGAMWIVADTFRPDERDGSLRHLEPLPFQLAGTAEEIGWTLREIILWRKNKTLPWSGRGRLRNGFEYVLFFVKSDAFKFHIDRVRDPISLEEWWVKWPERYNPLGKVPENVWDIPIPVQGSWTQSSLTHACPLPPALVERMIELSTDRDDVVLDPFAGSGMVVAEAERLGRRGIGTELVSKYVKAFATTVKPELLARRNGDVHGLADATEWLRETVLKLRAVKYPKVLMQEVARARPDLPRPGLGIVVYQPSRGQALLEPHHLIHARLIFLCDDDIDRREELRQALKEASMRKPASKFGIAGDIRVVGSDDLLTDVPRHRLFLYMNGRTYMTSGRVTRNELLTLAADRRDDRIAPIVADIEVREKPRALRVGS